MQIFLIAFVKMITREFGLIKFYKHFESWRIGKKIMLDVARIPENYDCSQKLRGTIKNIEVEKLYRLRTMSPFKSVISSSKIDLRHE